MGALNFPGFWKMTPLTRQLRNAGSLKYLLLDNSYRMAPLIRAKGTTFTNFLAGSDDAKKCKIIVNGNVYGLDSSGYFWVTAGRPDNPSDTLIQGQIILNGKVIAGDSRPQSFWFGQVSAAGNTSFTYTAGSGDPPAASSTFAAIGGAGPLIISKLKFGIGNRYKPGAPRGVNEPVSGPPPAAAAPYLIQRNNNTFQDASRLPPETGKTILAFCSQKQILLVAVQPHGASPGQTHADIAFDLIQLGFDNAIFLDGSDSATMVVDGKIIVAPGQRKDNSIDVGVGFFR